MSTHVCVYQHTDVCKHDIQVCAFSWVRQDSLPSTQGKLTPLLSGISEALTVNLGIPWCLSNGRNLGRPAEGENSRGWGICPCLCHHIIQIDMLLLSVNSLESNNDFNKVPLGWKDGSDGKWEISLLNVHCCLPGCWVAVAGCKAPAARAFSH